MLKVRIEAGWINLWDIIEMKQVVQWTFSRWGETDVAINIVNVKQPPIAGAIGGNAGGLLYLHIVGTIYLDLDFLKMHRFTNNELLFVLAHESAHYYEIIL